MLKTVFYHFSLFWLCLRLIINISIFSLKILFNKILSKSWLFPLILIFCFSLLALNIFLLKEKSVVRVVSQEIMFPELKLSDSSYQDLTQAEINSRIEYYSELENQGIKNLNLYLNLAVLYQSKDQNLSKEYLEKAKQIDPNNLLFQ